MFRPGLLFPAFLLLPGTFGCVGGGDTAPPLNIAGAFAWGGHADTDLRFDEFASGDFTMAAWFFAQHPRGLLGPVFGAQGDDFFLGTLTYSGTTGQTLLLSVRGSAQSYEVDLDPDEWHHLATVRRGAAMEVWLDGEHLQPDLTLTGGALSGPSPSATLRLARISDGEQMSVNGVDRVPQFYGFIDDVAVFDQALGAADVEALASTARLSDELPAGLVAALIFDSALPDGAALPAEFQRTATFVSMDMPWEGVEDLEPAVPLAVSDDRDAAFDVALALPPFHTNTFYLPFDNSQLWSVGQGYNGDASHFGTAAFSTDFNPAEAAALGAPLTAATTGWVRLIEPDEFHPTHQDQNNRVRLRSGIEEITYLHVQNNAAVAYGVEEGDDMFSGSLITRIGDYPDQLSGDHLHIGMAIDQMAWAPIAYRDYEVYREGDGTWEYVARGVPRQGELLRSVASNTVPMVRIQQPVDGASVSSGGIGVTLEAEATDAETGCCGIGWYSDRDGFLGSGGSLLIGLSSGTHRILVQAQDAEGAASTDVITLYVSDNPPTATITSSPGAELYRDEPGVFTGKAPDPTNPTEDLCASATWTTDQPGDDVGSGCTWEARFSTLGSRTVTFTVTAGDGAQASDAVMVDVIEVPELGPPVVTILEPTAETPISWTTATTLSGHASDPDGDTALEWRWQLSDADGSVHELGDAASLSWLPGDDVSFNCGGSQVTLLLEVTDSAGTTGSDEVTVFVHMPPC